MILPPGDWRPCALSKFHDADKEAVGRCDVRRDQFRDAFLAFSFAVTLYHKERSDIALSLEASYSGREIHDRALYQLRGTEESYGVRKGDTHARSKRLLFS